MIGRVLSWFLARTLGEGVTMSDEALQRVILAALNGESEAP